MRVGLIQALGLMRKFFLISILAISSSATSASERAQEFLSWYDGWGGHTIWGIGEVSGSYSGTTVTCGTTLIRVRPIFDSHAVLQPPTPEQTPEFAKTANLELLRNIEAVAGRCKFDLSDKA